MATDLIVRVILWFTSFCCARNFHDRPNILAATSPAPTDLSAWHPEWRGECFSCGVPVQSATWRGRRVWRAAQQETPE